MYQRDLRPKGRGVEATETVRVIYNIIRTEGGDRAVDEQERLLGELSTLNLLRAMRGLLQRPRGRDF